MTFAFLPDTLWQSHPAVQWPVVLVAALVAAIVDARTRRIPNALTGPLFLAGVVWAATVGGWAGLGDSLVGALLAMAPFFALFAFAGGGAGDAKLMAGVGAWLGTLGGLLAVVSVMIAGGLIAVCVVIARGKVRDAWANLLWILCAARDAVFGKPQPAGPLLPSVQVLHTMPYGLAIFVGVSAAFGATLL